jgi:hypothetical protein
MSCPPLPGEGGPSAASAGGSGESAGWFVDIVTSNLIPNREFEGKHSEISAVPQADMSAKELTALRAGYGGYPGTNHHSAAGRLE